MEAFFKKKLAEFALTGLRKSDPSPGSGSTSSGATQICDAQGIPLSCPLSTR